MSNVHSRTSALKIVLACSVGFGALTAGAFSAASAQDAEVAESDRRLNTVTITATKREQTLQQVPVAVSVVDDAVIEKAEIQDLNDLQSLVPSLRVGQLQTSANTNFVIRGFGNGANNAGIEPSVGVFIDGVYRSRSAAQVSDLPNLQRVEVLRGPQSTLFGKNASAGVISIVTRRPQFEQGGSVEGTVSNYNGYRLKGDITGPLSDTVAYSLSANYNKRDGYADDLALGSDANDRNRFGLRGDLLFTPSEDLEIRLIADYDEIDETCCIAGNLVNGSTGAAIFAVGGALDPENLFSFDVFNNFESTNDIQNSGISGQVDYDFDFATLTSITSLRNSELQTNQDSDFTSADLIGLNASDTEIETFTQEVRLTSNNSDGPIDWMIGGFYFDEEVTVDNQIQYGDDIRGYIDLLSAGGLAGAETALFGVPVGTFFQSGQGLTERFGQDNTAWSVFGTLDFHVNDRLTATIGLNYTEDEKDAFGSATSTDTFSAIDLVQAGFNAALGQQLIGAAVDPTNPAAVGAFALANPALFDGFVQTANVVARDLDPTSPTANPLAALVPLQFFPQFAGFPNAVENGSTSDDELTYTLRLAYDATENLNVYGSYATGFKASSWNLSRDSRPFASDHTPGTNLFNPVTGAALPGNPGTTGFSTAGLTLPNLVTGTRFAGPEEAEVFEIGLKGSFDTFAFNVAIFDQTIEGFQSNVFTGTGFALANAGEQSTQGLEFDATWSATDNLTLSLAGTFLDPTYDSFEQSAGGDISGTQPSLIPEEAFSASALYEFTFNSWDSFVRADWQYEGESAYFDAVNPTFVDALGQPAPDLQALLGEVREVSTINASAGLVLANDLGITLWGRNIFDDEYITTAFPSVAQAGSISGYPSQPATYGVTVRKKF